MTMRDPLSGVQQPSDKELAATLLCIRSHGNRDADVANAVVDSLKSRIQPPVVDRIDNVAVQVSSKAPQVPDPKHTFTSVAAIDNGNCKGLNEGTRNSHLMISICETNNTVSNNSNLCDKVGLSYNAAYEDEACEVPSSFFDCTDGTRHAKVQAALNSQPQRGRKRDNLSETERLELTRTRNREHAKSTRIRKKARYEDLLDKECRLLTLLKVAESNTNRRQRVVDFLGLRENMLQSLLSGSSSYVDGSEDTASSVVVYESIFQQIERLIDGSQKYSFTHNGPASEADVTAIDNFRKFDDWLVGRVRSCFGTDKAQTRLQLYFTQLNPMDIAISDNDTAMVQIELTLALGRRKVPLASLWNRFKFYSDSDTIVSSEIVVTNDFFDKANDVFQNLVMQTSHPSVVSLEPTSHASSLQSSPRVNGQYYQDTFVSVRHESRSEEDQASSHRSRAEERADLGMAF